MSIGDRHRLSGTLLTAKRGPILQIADGGVWALDIDHDHLNLIGRRVTIEGTRSGFDRLAVDWIVLEAPPQIASQVN
jgi:hypothetical protein